jgi:hypothetical protein
MISVQFSPASFKSPTGITRGVEPEVCTNPFRYMPFESNNPTFLSREMINSV